MNVLYVCWCMYGMSSICVLCLGYYIISCYMLSTNKEIINQVHRNNKILVHGFAFSMKRAGLIASMYVCKVYLTGSVCYLYLTHCLRTITSLTSRMDKLEADLDSFKNVRTRQSSLSRMPPDITPLTGRKTGRGGAKDKRWSMDSLGSIPSLSFDPSKKSSFVWEMPFTVKCIGTFKCVILVLYQVSLCCVMISW